MNKKTTGKHILECSKSSVKLKMRILALLIGICALVFVLLNINTINAYFISIFSVSNPFTIEAEYIITFDANTGTGTMLPQTISYNVSTNLNANEFTKTDNSFVGWNTEPDGTGTSYRDLQAVSNLGNITLYARWAGLDAVAEINGTTYTSLQAAVNAVNTNISTTTTIRLLKDTSENITIPSGKDIIIDFQGYELRNGNTNAVIENKGTLEIRNSNIIMTATNNGAINNKSGGYLKINGGIIQNIASNGKQTVYNDGGTVDIYGGVEISNASGTGSQKRAAVDNNSGTMRILDCKIEGKNYDGVKNSSTLIIGTTNDGNMDVTNPVIIGKRYGINAVANFSFYDGIFKGQTDAIDNDAKANVLEPGYWIEESTETIGSDIYKTAYLTSSLHVSFNANGGVASEYIRYLNSGDQLGSLPTATCQYKTFNGWYTEPTGGMPADPTQIITDSITLYAHWDDIYVTVFFDGNQGTSSESSRSTILGDPLNTLPTATREDYVFWGWYTQASGGDPISTSTIVEESTTYYAHWKSQKVAQIGDTLYDSLQEAIRAVPRDNTQTTVLLLCDTLEAVEILQGQNVLLDMQGHILHNDGSKQLVSTVNSPANGRKITVDNFGKLTLVGGQITSGSTQGTINCEANAELYISTTLVQATGDRQAVYNEGGYVEISGTARLIAKNTGEYHNYVRGAVQNAAGGTIVITGGSITSTTGHAIVNQHGSTLIIGTDDGNVDISTPIITGTQDAILNIPYSTNPEGEVYFYDGILKGKTNTVEGNITGIDSNSTRVTSSEIIGGETYYTEYLQSNN